MTWMTFYAAASLEQISRSLHMNSSDKLPLLQQSLSYYEKTKSYLQQAPYSLKPLVRQEFEQRPASSSSSICSSTAPTISPIERTASPSSTLPSPVDTPLDSNPCDEDEYRGITEYTKLSSQPQQDFGISEFLLSRSLARYRTHLTGMQAQLRYHIVSVTKQITTLQEVRRARRSNQPNLFAAFSAGGIDGMDMDELRKAELKARVERLRETGWKERFDAQRYQNLCEQALAELD
jgi:hypothetical protein